MKPSDAIMVLKKHNDNKRGYPVEIPDIRVLVEAIDTVVKALEKPTYTAEDMEDFAEWIGNNKYYLPFFNPMSDSIVWAKGGTRDGFILTAQLRERWEQERREK